MKSRGRGPAGQAVTVRAWPAALRAWPLWRARTWPVWTLPRWLLGFVAAVVIMDAAGLGFAAAHPVAGLHALILFAFLVVCDGASLELTRRAGEKAGVARGMAAVGELPGPMLLP